MSVGGGVGRMSCACTNITIMQLFYELKQQYPSISDQLVASCLSDHSTHVQLSTCREKLERELQKLPRANPYPHLMGHRMTTDIVKTRNINENYINSQFPNGFVQFLDTSDKDRSTSSLQKDDSGFSSPLESPINKKNKQLEKKKDFNSNEFTPKDNISPNRRNSADFCQEDSTSDKFYPITRSKHFNSTKQRPWSIHQEKDIKPQEFGQFSKFSESVVQSSFSRRPPRLDSEKVVRPSAFPVPLIKNSDCEKKPPISPSSIKRYKNSPTKLKNVLVKENFSTSSNESTNIEINQSRSEFRSYKEHIQEYFSPSNDFVSNSAIKLTEKNQRKLEDSPGAIKKVPTPKQNLPTLEEGIETTYRPDFSVKPNDINLSVNVNCSVEVTSPPRKQATLQITPELSWCQNTSPRSFTSVNLTLRTPTSEPQPPIDICSANSSLTYSTSSFNPKQGLQSRLQITVGPTGVGNVTSVRSRPRSSYIPQEEEFNMIPNRSGSMPDLVDAVVQTSTDTKGKIIFLYNISAIVII